jgi:hypothetical protein
MIKKERVLKLNDNEVYFCHQCNAIAKTSFAGMIYCDGCFTAAIHGHYIRKTLKEAESENYLLRRIVNYQDQLLRKDVQ